MKTAIIVGGGMCGCTCAHLLKKAGWKVRIFEKDNVLGGGCRTFFCGGHPYTKGPRPLYTPYEKAVSYLAEFVHMEDIDLYLLTYVEGDHQFYSFPVHEDDIPMMHDADQIYLELSEAPPIDDKMNFAQYYVASIGETLYNKFINQYSKKMWDVESNNELTDFSWSLKGMALKRGTRRVRPDLLMAHPTEMTGYNNFFKEATKEVEVNFNTDITEFDVENQSIKIGEEWIKGDILVSTTSVDMLMNYSYGELRYIGRDFYELVLPCEHIVPDPISYLHYGGKEKFTRIVEYKKLYRYQSPTTLLGIEVPSHNNKLYPYPIKSEREKAQQYLDNLPENVFSMGRLGQYKYDNIGDVIMEAYDLIEKVE